MSAGKNWSEADRARHRKVRELVKDKPTIDELTARGELSGKTVSLGVYVAARALAHELRKAREAAGLSLADVAERTGIDKAALSRLETGRHGNPTLETLERYAEALGMRMKVTLEPVPGRG